MQALGYSSMNVYGQSMGSCISQQLVIDHPERVRKLVLDSVSYSIRIPEAQNLFNKIEAVANNTTPASPGITKEAYACLAWNGTWDGLSGISQNTMLVVGTADVITPQAIAVQMAGQINGTWLVRFKDLPHIGNHEAPVEYGENALDFFGMNESPPYANLNLFFLVHLKSPNILLTMFRRQSNVLTSLSPPGFVGRTSAGLAATGRSKKRHTRERRSETADRSTY